jgi:RHS repeat-associated protein
LAGYDSRGNAALSVDPNGNSVITQYDGASRMTETNQLQRITGLGWQSPAGNQSFLSGGRGLVRTQSVYDGNGNLLTLIDDKGNETSYTYDLLDRQATMTFQDGSTRSYIYDWSSDLSTYSDENGSSINGAFDSLGRRYQVFLSKAAGVIGTMRQFFQFDGLSRLTESRDEITTTANTYNHFYFDSLGRVAEETQSVNTSTYICTTHSQFFSFVVQQLTYPNGRQDNNSYDLLYRRTNVTESGVGSIATWTFAGPGQVANVALGNGLECSCTNNAATNTAVQYNVSNPAWGSSTTDRLGYDGTGRNITKRYMNSSSGLVVGFTTAYDRASNKTYERHLHAESRSHLYRPIDTSGNVGLGYDSLNRLLQYQRGTLASNGGLYNAGGGSITSPIALPGTDASRTYNLDGLGNWKNTGYIPIQSNGSEGSLVTELRQHNSTNELTQFGPLGTSTTVTYDHGSNFNNSSPLIAAQGNGNIASDGTLQYQYDVFNRLTQVNNSGGSILAVYTYDALNRRVRKVVTNGGVTGSSALNGTTNYYYNGQRIIEDRYASTGTPTAATAQYAWGRYIDELIQQKLPAISGSPVFYLLSDLLYRSVALTNNSGGVVEAYDTDAYGNTICYSGPGTDGLWFTNDDVTTNTPQNCYIFTGRQYDPETLLYNFRERYYGPRFGRFISRDPIVYSGGINLFEYCGSNPSVATDPMGQDGGAGVVLTGGATVAAGGLGTSVTGASALAIGGVVVAGAGIGAGVGIALNKYTPVDTWLGSGLYNVFWPAPAPLPPVLPRPKPVPVPAPVPITECPLGPPAPKDTTYRDPDCEFTGQKMEIFVNMNAHARKASNMIWGLDLGIFILLSRAIKRLR